MVSVLVSVLIILKVLLVVSCNLESVPRGTLILLTCGYFGRDEIFRSPESHGMRQIEIGDPK